MTTPDPTVPGGPDDPALFSRYKLIRDEIIHEDNLIGVRLGWFLGSQAFLFTALAIANNGQHMMPSLGTNYFFPLVPLVAILSCLLILAGVMAGMQALRAWRHLMATPEYSDISRMPRIPGDRVIMRLGWAAPVSLPIIFLAAWTYVLAQGLVR